jgi:hypothetical protein
MSATNPGKDDAMISKSPITLADARRFSIGSDPITWTRLIVTFDEVSNAGTPENPRWVRDGCNANR